MTFRNSPFMEQGHINISLRTLKKIADALDLRIVLENKSIEEAV